MTVIIRQNLMETDPGPLATPSTTHATETASFLGRRYKVAVKEPPGYNIAKSPAKSMRNLMKLRGHRNPIFRGVSDLSEFAADLEEQDSAALDYWGIIPARSAMGSAGISELEYVAPNFAQIRSDMGESPSVQFVPATNLNSSLYFSPDLRAMSSNLPGNNGNGSLFNPSESSHSIKSRMNDAFVEEGVMPSFGILPVLNRSSTPDNEEFHPVGDHSSAD